MSERKEILARDRGQRSAHSSLPIGPRSSRTRTRPFDGFYSRHASRSRLGYVILFLFFIFSAVGCPACKVPAVPLAERKKCRGAFLSVAASDRRQVVNLVPRNKFKV